MDKLREKMNQFKEQIEKLSDDLEASEAANKQLIDQQTEREQEFISFQNRISVLEEELERKEAQLEEAKQLQKDSEASLNHGDVLSKRVEVLEEKLEEAETQLRAALDENRNLDLTVEGLQRRITQNEKDAEIAENKYEELNEKYLAVKHDLDETIKTLEEL
ncbi:tropomyosin-2 [Linderina macrospora]|uniref:Tropomyosin-2 n=1 Tax=Linderina macrospora TaxID=4868 RepID=A0ACC1JHR9_9FUNG|nr:tropomyosin-2 [Linderina macrospora]